MQLGRTSSLRPCAPVRRAHPRVVVALEDPDLRAAVTAVLELAGHRVQPVGSGVELLELFGPWLAARMPAPPSAPPSRPKRRGAADALITSLDGREPSAFEVGGALRAAGWRGGIVTLCPPTDAPTRRVRELGNSAIVREPVERDELERALRGVLSPAR